jgi:hypothetical protein
MSGMICLVVWLWEHTAGRKIDLYLGPIMSTSRKALACEGIEVVDTPGGCKVEKMN